MTLLSWTPSGKMLSKLTSMRTTTTENTLLTKLTVQVEDEGVEGGEGLEQTNHRPKFKLYTALQIHVIVQSSLL